MENYMFRTLEAGEIECRPVRNDLGGLTVLLYKDARCDMNILDQTVGEMNWQRRHEKDHCLVSIWDNEKKQWVAKEDVGSPSSFERAKGLASDSFKRACVNWGIGRELYTAPNIVIPASAYNADLNGNCTDRFFVSEIEYDETRSIVKLVIKNERTKAAVYTFGCGEEGTAKETPGEGGEAGENAVGFKDGRFTGGELDGRTPEEVLRDPKAGWNVLRRVYKGMKQGEEKDAAYAAVKAATDALKETKKQKTSSKLAPPPDAQMIAPPESASKDAEKQKTIREKVREAIKAGNCTPELAGALMITLGFKKGKYLRDANENDLEWLRKQGSRDEVLSRAAEFLLERKGGAA